MRKIAAHYWLRPDGTFGKFPIIEFDKDGVIVDIRERESFLEEPFLELINGFLCPGFITICSDSILTKEQSELKRYFNRQVISGVKGIGLSNIVFDKLGDEFIKEIQFIQYQNEVLETIDCEIFLLELLKSNHAGIEDLQKYTLENAEILGVEEKYGSLEIGKSPGIISIAGMDYTEMKLTASSKIKLII